MHDNNHQSTKNDYAEKLEYLSKSRINSRLQKIKRQVLFKITIFATIFSVITFAARVFVYPQLSDHTILYLQLAEVAIIGYSAMRVVSELATKLLNDRHPDTQARSARSIIRIGDSLIIVAVVVIMLARDPYVTLVVTTIAGINLAISIQSVISNSIAGMVLVIVRPFKIGDTITKFGITGSVRDIGLLYVRLSTIQDKKTVLVPNSTMLGTAIVKEKWCTWYSAKTPVGE